MINFHPPPHLTEGILEQSCKAKKEERFEIYDEMFALNSWKKNNVRELMMELKGNLVWKVDKDESKKKKGTTGKILKLIFRWFT